MCVCTSHETTHRLYLRKFNLKNFSVETLELHLALHYYIIKAHSQRASIQTLRASTHTIRASIHTHRAGIHPLRAVTPYAFRHAHRSSKHLNTPSKHETSRHDDM